MWLLIMIRVSGSHVVEEEITAKKEIKELIQGIDGPQSQNNDNNSNLKV